MNLRILMVNSASAGMWGGGEMWFTAAASWFAARDHVVQVVGRTGSRFLDTVRGEGIDAVDFDFGGDYDPIATWHAFQLEREFRPDVVLVNFNKEAWLFGRGARLLGCPVLARHGLTLFKDKLVHRLVYRWHMDRVVVNAPSIRDEYARLGFDTTKIAVVLNGVRPVAPRPGDLRRELGVGPAQLLVGAAGRLDPQKRFDRYLRIAEQLLRDGINARFVLYGDGAEADRLRAQWEATGLGDRLLFGGFCRDFAARCTDLDLFVMTSDNEGTPNAMLEAMAQGVPCVAFGVGAVPEILTGECSHGLVAPGDEAGMLSVVRSLLADGEARSALAAAQRHRATVDLNFDASMEQYLAVLRSMA